MNGGCINMLRYKYKEGHILKRKRSDLLLEKQTYVLTNRGTRKSAYEYLCLVCGNRDIIHQDAIPRGCGCNVCSGNKIKIGYNDLFTSQPDVAKLLLNKEDGFSNTTFSNEKVFFKCPICNSTTEKMISNVSNYGFHCSFCGDNISIPEKFAMAVLKQLNIDFIHQYSKKYANWVGDYRYDFYLPNYDCILETHGSQHYEECQYSNYSGGLEQVQLNDKNKEKLALFNVSNYVVVDCRRTELNFMKDSFINSSLKMFFSFDSVDWNSVFQVFNSELIQSISELYNDGLGVMDISRKLQIDKETVRKNLIRANELNIVNYSVSDDTRRRKNVAKKNKERCSKKVICIETGTIYESCAECDRANGFSRGRTSSYINGTRKSPKGKTFEFYNEN